MRRMVVLGVAGMMAVQAGCAQGPRPLRGPSPVDWRAIAGCWRLVEPHDDAVIVSFHTTPSTARAARRREGARAARSSREHLSNPQEYWRVTPRNTVESVVHEGLFGSYSEFLVRGDGLVGRRYPFSDVPGAELEWKRAAAVRAACPGGSAPSSGRETAWRGR